MRHFIVRGFVIAFALAAAALPAQPQQLGGRMSHWGQIWGTWVWRTGIGTTLPSLTTIHVDGTVSVSDGTMFGGIRPNSTTRLTPLHGVWERTGWQSFGGTSLWLVFDATTGLLTSWGRVRVSAQMADDFNSFQGKAFVEYLACSTGTPVNCPDPLDPMATWVPITGAPPDGIPISGTRVERVPAGPLQ